MQFALDDALKILFVDLLLGLAVYLFIRYGWTTVMSWYHREERRYDRVLNNQLLYDISPRIVLMLQIVLVVFAFLVPWQLLGHIVWGVVFAIASFFLPPLLIRHLEQKRRLRLELQLVDGLTTLASGVRASLTLLQSMELLVRNMRDPIRQEFAQLLREYQMGVDLNQAMRNTSNRIGSSHYRLVFTALEMHRVRGGDAGETLDRIAESVREIQRLEGKLDALTAEGRMQALMMAIMPIAILFLYYLIDSEGVTRLFTESLGRVVLLVAGLLILAGFLWIRKIMAVDI